MKLEEKLNEIEKEIMGLKLIIMQQITPKTVVSLKGSLKGVKIEEEQITSAKKSLFKTGA